MFTYNQTIHVNLFTLLFGVSMIVLIFLKELSQVQLCIYLNENAANIFLFIFLFISNKFYEILLQFFFSV